MEKTALLTISLIAASAFLSPVYAAEKAKSVEKTKARPNAVAKSETKLDLAKIFENKLTDADGKPVSSAPLAKAKYTLVYFSAHWCVPCRAFTPELVKFVAENRKDGNLEVVFLSSDESKEKMTAYMKEAKMPWGGSLRRGAPPNPVDSGVGGIPRVIVFDSEGKLIMQSKEMGRPQLLAALKEKLK